MNILSLFDGMSCGQIALSRAGMPYDKYYAAEIDKHAIQVTQVNYPDTIQLGTIKDWEKWDIPSPDLVMGGFSCQSFSTAGKQLGLEDVRGQLLYDALNIIKHYKPKNFLLENVKGLLCEKFKPVMDLIYRELESVGYDVTHTLINSALVSAQNRERVYFTNFAVSQPEDKGILLKDVIDDYAEVKCGAIRGRNIIDGKQKDYNGAPTEQRLEERKDDKTNALTTVQKDNVLIIKEATKKGYCEINPGECVDLENMNSKTRRGRKMVDKSNTLMAGGMHFYKLITEKDFTYNFDIPININNRKMRSIRSQGPNGTRITFDDIYFRKLTPVECERLQTAPENYTNHVSNSQRYKMLGNGWTIDVIVHILQKMQKNKRPEKQLELF